jgi:hypothetical protein
MMMGRIDYEIPLAPRLRNELKQQVAREMIDAGVFKGELPKS